MNWIKGWWRRRKAKQRRAEAACNGELTYEIVLYDGAGKRWGSVGTARPEKLDLMMTEMTKSAVTFATRDTDAQESLGWTPPPPPGAQPEGEDPGGPCG